jgi:tRNA threonylcarbamoyl adenosine modification protein YeaZ
VLLAIDTSAGTSVAVVDLDGGVLAEVSDPNTRGHAESIGLFIERALAEASTSPRELSGVVAGMGPGPFTGLRVGIAAARAFAAGIGRPVVPIRSHDAVAFGRTAATLVVTDARRREVAWSAYAAPDADGFPALVTGPELARPDNLATVVEGYDRYQREDAAAISAASLGMLAERLYAAGRAFGPAEPLYLRAPDVTLSAPKPVTA